MGSHRGIWRFGAAFWYLGLVACVVGVDLSESLTHPRIDEALNYFVSFLE